MPGKSFSLYDGTSDVALTLSKAQVALWQLMS